jgi:hypothetical protein
MALAKVLRDRWPWLAAAAGIGVIAAMRRDETTPTPGAPAARPWTPAIEDRRALADADSRYRAMKGKPIGVTLHATGFSRGDRDNAYDRVHAHYVITPGGKILWLHPHDVRVRNAFDYRRSIQIEMVGNFRSSRGKSYKPEKFGTHDLTPEQARAGRFLLDYLRNSGAIEGQGEVTAHRQSNRQRGNDPGPEVWREIGQWAIDERGWTLGPTIKNKGKGIPDSWKTERRIA